VESTRKCWPNFGRLRRPSEAVIFVTWACFLAGVPALDWGRISPDSR
jgi:hypothetical protein